MRVRALMFGVALALAAVRVRGDGPPAAAAQVSHWTAFSATAGGAWVTPIDIFGGVHDAGRGTALVRLEVHRTLVRSENHVLEAVFGVVPLELESGTPVPADSPLSGQSLNRSTVYGAGLDPLGFSMAFGNGRWRPFWSASGGLRMFVDRVPIPRGTRFNFTADLGLGMYWIMSSGLAVSIALNLHHVSNANLGEKNPGVNYLVLAVGLRPMR